MSVKTQFLNKLKNQQSPSRSFNNKSQTDIAEFRMRMQQLQDAMESWLMDTGIDPESSTVPLTDLLVESGTFTLPGIILRYQNRSIIFTPLYLYGQGVKGCVEVSLIMAGKTTALSRLFMQAGKTTGWTCTQPGSLSRPERAFDEEAFFGMIDGLLP